MSETYTPAGNVGSSFQRATVGEAATGTHGQEFMRDDITKIADKIRFLSDAGFPTVSKIQFPAVQVADGDPNALDDYEEGTWTPSDASGDALSFPSSAGFYEKIGRLVIARGKAVYPVTAGSAGAQIGGFPFVVANATANDQGWVTWTAETTLRYLQPLLNTSRSILYTAAGANIANSALSSDIVYFTVVYHT